MQESVNFLEVGGDSGKHKTWDDDPWAQNMFAPLQLHAEPVWRYNGKEDAMRLTRDGFAPEVLRQIMGVLFATSELPSPTKEEAKPLICFAEESIVEQRSFSFHISAKAFTKIPNSYFPKPSL